MFLFEKKIKKSGRDTHELGNRDKLISRHLGLLAESQVCLSNKFTRTVKTCTKTN
jgi:hypothetical protein